MGPSGGAGGCRTALLLVNRHSRAGAGAAPSAEALLRGQGLEVVTEECDQASSLAGTITRRASGIGLVVVGGGDGTLNAALPGILATGLPLGVLPLGTANDLARTIGVPLDLPGAVEVIGAGRTRRIDVGSVNGRPFLNVASIGLGVDLARALTRDAKSRWGRLGYAVAALRVVRRLRPFGVEVVQGTAVHRLRTVHVAVGNGRHYGGGMTVSENAAIDDGKLNLYSLGFSSTWQLLRALPSLRSGQMSGWTEIGTLEASEIVIRTSRPRSVNTDGEITATTPAHFRVLPAAARVFVP